MKKLIVTVATLALSLGAFAQINFGVKAGGNLSTISGVTSSEEGGNLEWGGVNLGSADVSQSMKFGFNVGAWAEYMVMPMFGVQVELNYSTQGVNEKLVTSTDLFGGSSSTTKKTWAANYINVPILAKFHFGPIRAYVGPQLGFALGLNTTTETITSDNTNIKEAAVDNFNTFDLSLALGAQYKLTENIGVDARYNIGLTNVFPAVKNDKGEITAEAWGKQGVVQLGVFYEF